MGPFLILVSIVAISFVLWRSLYLFINFFLLDTIISKTFSFSIYVLRTFCLFCFHLGNVHSFWLGYIADNFLAFLFNPWYSHYSEEPHFSSLHVFWERLVIDQYSCPYSRVSTMWHAF